MTKNYENNIEIFNKKLRDNKIELIKHILEQRRYAITTIKYHIKKLTIKRRSLPNFILKLILKQRKAAILTIQRNLRLMLIYRHLNYIKENEKLQNFRVYYPNIKVKNAEVKIYDFCNHPYKIFKLHNCSVTQTLQSYINKNYLLKAKYLFQFIVDGYTVINPDFPSCFDSEGNCFNIIRVKDYMSKLKEHEEYIKNYKNKLKYNTSKEVPKVYLSEKMRKPKRFTYGSFDCDTEESSINEKPFEKPLDKIEYHQFDHPFGSERGGVGCIKKDEVKPVGRYSLKFSTTKELCNLSISPKSILRKVSSKNLVKKVSFNDKVEFKF